MLESLKQPSQHHTWILALIVILVLLGVYVLAYYSMVMRVYRIGPRDVAPHYSGFGLHVLPVVFRDLDFVRYFAPMHGLDRLLRPRFWEP